eukprot:2037865-Rhodomonas_salina.1
MICHTHVVLSHDPVTTKLPSGAKATVRMSRSASHMESPHQCVASAIVRLEDDSRAVVPCTHSHNRIPSSLGLFPYSLDVSLHMHGKQGPSKQEGDGTVHADLHANDVRLCHLKQHDLAVAPCHQSEIPVHFTQRVRGRKPKQSETKRTAEKQPTITQHLPETVTHTARQIPGREDSDADIPIAHTPANALEHFPSRGVPHADGTICDRDDKSSIMGDGEVLDFASMQVGAAEQPMRLQHFSIIVLLFLPDAERACLVSLVARGPPWHAQKGVDARVLGPVAPERAADVLEVVAPLLRALEVRLHAHHVRHCRQLRPCRARPSPRQP